MKSRLFASACRACRCRKAAPPFIWDSPQPIPWGGTQVIPLFSPSEEAMLEYDISRLLHTLSHPQRPLIGIMSTLSVEGDSLTPPWLIVEEAA